MFVHDDEFSSRTWHLQGEVTIVEFAPPMNDAWHALARRASCVVQMDLRRPATDSPGFAYDGVGVVRLHNISSDEVVVEHTDGDTAGTRHTLGVFGSSDVSAVVSGCAAIMFNCLVDPGHAPKHRGRAPRVLFEPPRKIRLPNFAKELKRRKLSSIVRENGGMRARTAPFMTPPRQV